MRRRKALAFYSTEWHVGYKTHVLGKRSTVTHKEAIYEPRKAAWPAPAVGHIQHVHMRKLVTFQHIFDAGS
ncbi:hypothetical protein NDU88_008889 [Pleurodeles waltl]|uniref:Uncharacterized protein n=1 Tax=Pleurodeles waltl TaxID=8319 RepID=A0AAV7QRA2_PLEWA|nr:hypothetical protein NDU88_008889 [Pleurodeles waltl]